MTIKLVIFDLDGVLVDARELHYEAMNQALLSVGKASIPRDVHLSTFDGLPTKKKLNILSEKYRLDKELHNEVWRKKQEKTLDLINAMGPDERMIGILRALKQKGYSIYVASNSVKKTIKMMLLRRGLFEYIDEYLSNEDVTNPKPSPEIYLRCMVKESVSPRETLIIEDSHVGRKSAIESGAHLCAVTDMPDVTLAKINESIEFAEDKNKKLVSPKWQGGKMNVLIPMAGAGSRFAKAGYTFPKPLIEVEGKPMIQLVTENLNIEARHIYVVQKAHYDKYNLKALLNLISPGCEIVQVDGMTEGAACTTLLAKEFIDNDEPLIFANSDQYIEWDSNEFMYSMMADEIDAGMLTFKSLHPKWSFAELDEDGFVSRVAEKEPISDNATVGIYYWQKGSDYVKYAEQMIEKDLRVNNEFYVCPVFNEAIEDGKKIKIFPVEKMMGLGTPEDLAVFLNRKK